VFSDSVCGCLFAELCGRNGEPLIGFHVPNRRHQSGDLEETRWHRQPCADGAGGNCQALGADKMEPGGRRAGRRELGGDGNMKSDLASLLKYI